MQSTGLATARRRLNGQPHFGHLDRGRWRGNVRSLTHPRRHGRAQPMGAGRDHPYRKPGIFGATMKTASVRNSTTAFRSAVAIADRLSGGVKNRTLRSDVWIPCIPLIPHGLLRNTTTAPCPDCPDISGQSGSLRQALLPRTLRSFPFSKNPCGSKIPKDGLPLPLENAILPHVRLSILPSANRTIPMNESAGRSAKRFGRLQLAACGKICGIGDCRLWFARFLSFWPSPKGRKRERGTGAAGRNSARLYHGREGGIFERAWVVMVM